MPTTDLSIIIDPGGTPPRPGINLQVFPSGAQPLQPVISNPPSRTSSAALLAGGYADIQEFSFDATLEYQDFMRLKAVLDWQDQSRRDLTPFEVLIYNLTEPFSELTTSRTRFIVPGTSIISQEDYGGGYFNFIYWVALQGVLVLEKSDQKGQCFEVTLSFFEGTKLLSSDE